jgi:hypothetical protein
MLTELFNNLPFLVACMVTVQPTGHVSCQFSTPTRILLLQYQFSYSDHIYTRTAPASPFSSDNLYQKFVTTYQVEFSDPKFLTLKLFIPRILKNRIQLAFFWLYSAYTNDKNKLRNSLICSFSSGALTPLS